MDPRIVLTRACIACGEHAHVPYVRSLVACRTCGMVYFPGLLTREENIALYGPKYFLSAEYAHYLADRSIHEVNFRDRIRTLRQWLPQGKHLFEIGSAYGFFLNLAKHYWHVEGCDIAEEPCRYAQSSFDLDIHCGEFADLPLPEQSVDALCMWDTIEHIDALDRTLTQAARVLRPGGILALTTGDIGSVLARVQGSRWRQIHPPTHLWYFSRKTLFHTLERFGFESKWSRHIGIWRSVSQIVHGLTGHTVPALSRMAIPLNTYDLLMVIARRSTI